MVDCRSLIEFCRTFDHRRYINNQYHAQLSSPTRTKSLINPLSHPFCEHSPFAAIDIVILLLALTAVGVLTYPYFKFIFHQTFGILRLTLQLAGEVIYNAPVAYAAGLVLTFVSAIAAWEIIDYKTRKCGNPCCRGLKKPVEFDIQLESEESMRFLPDVLSEEGFGVQPLPLELGQHHKELEAELKKMAPPNGRTVLIFRAPCGCPSGRMEVWGHKKVRKVKKYR